MGDIKEIIENHGDRESIDYSIDIEVNEDDTAHRYVHHEIKQDAFKAGHESLAPLLEQAMRQLKYECYCDVDYNGHQTICDPCETLTRIKAKLEDI